MKVGEIWENKSQIKSRIELHRYCGNDKWDVKLIETDDWSGLDWISILELEDISNTRLTTEDTMISTNWDAEFIYNNYYRISE